MDLGTYQWNLMEEPVKALQVFECATVYWSGEKKVTVSALPSLVRGLLKSPQTACDAAPVWVFQAAASEEINACGHRHR